MLNGDDKRYFARERESDGRGRGHSGQIEGKKVKQLVCDPNLKKKIYIFITMTF